MWTFEHDLFAKGIKTVAGVDEAGRGPLAGPVVAAAVIVPPEYVFEQKIADSKKLSPRQRQKAYEEITANCLYAHAFSTEEQIDKINILRASLDAMARAIENLPKEPEWVLVDGPHEPIIFQSCTPIIDGDAKSISISCASIIAKVTRDAMMVEYDKLYPQYGFAGHKGYGTKAHRDAIYKHGPCPIHRKTFQPIKGMLLNS
ncbi:MAG: ribonuclease HII [PVC group bacterium]|nr:ribonuclease HII [PVC group bacterium]